MGDIFEELRESFGEDALNRATERTVVANWHELCVCGHLDRYHSPSIGGSFDLPAPRTSTIRDVEITTTHLFDGCAGAMPARGFETRTQTVDRDTGQATVTVHSTCPCPAFRPVARVDRPNRYFNQRVPADRSDPFRHPFPTGVRAFTTHLSRRRAAQASPDWATAEFDRRFTWIEGKRVCSLTHCTATVNVWPVFVDRADTSDLRCPKHR